MLSAPKVQGPIFWYCTDVDNSETFLEIETPINLIPDLAALGITEVDKGVCEDTPENRAAIRKAGLSHQPVWTTAGTETPLIQAFSGAQKAEVLMSSHGSILSKYNDPNSDYFTGIDLLLESDSANMVPAWVIAATRRWMRIAEERKETGKLVNPSIVGPPTRCRMKRTDGFRCQYWSSGTADYNGLCRVHLTRENGKDNTAQLVKARNRLQSASMQMVEVLENLALNADSEPTRLGAAREILDRAGLRGGVEIEVNGQIEVSSAAKTVRDRLANLRPREIGEIEAEVVEDGK